MHRGVVLLVLVAGGRVTATLARPGERPAADQALPSAPCRSQAELYDFLRTMLERAGNPALIGAAVAGEGYEENGAVVLEGEDWSVDLKGLRSVLGTPRVYLQGALMACALAAPGLAPGWREVLCEGNPKTDAPLLVVGAESTMAGVFMFPDWAGGWVAAPSRGALVGPLPDGPRETLIAMALQARGWMALEQILSRRGLVEIYHVVRQIEGLESEEGGAEGDPHAVAALALEGDPSAKEALRVYCAWIGSFAHYLALMGGTTGGVFISSPFVRALGPAFDQAAFAARFRHPGAPGEAGERYVAQIPAYLATVSMALVGLSTLFTPSDARFAGETAVHLLDC